MNTLRAELTVTPVYGQVFVQVSGSANFPEWDTGEEKAVSTDGAVLIATRPDAEGDVVIRILEGSEDEEGDLVFDGSLVVAEADSLKFGNDISAQRGTVVLSQVGDVKLRIYVVPKDAPQEVKVLLPRGAAQPLMPCHLTTSPWAVRRA
jgi:hypothetical protein